MKGGRGRRGACDLDPSGIMEGGTKGCCHASYVIGPLTSSSLHSSAKQSVTLERPNFQNGAQKRV